MKQPVIIAAKRIAFGKYGGRLRHLEPESLLEPLYRSVSKSNVSFG